MNPEDLMPVGECCVCGDMVDHSEAGFCATCGGAFCWGQCGSWGESGHECNNCKEELNHE